MSYNDSIIVERLRKEHGDDFCYVVEPWNLEGYQNPIFSDTLPNTIYSNNGGEDTDGVGIGTTAENWNQIANPAYFGIASTNNSDIGKVIVVGIRGRSLESEEVELKGTTVVSTVKKYNDIYSIEIISLEKRTYPQGFVSIGRYDDYSMSGFFNNTSITILNNTLKSRVAKYFVPAERDLYITNFRISGPRCKEKMSEWSMHESYPLEQLNSGVWHMMTSSIMNGFLDANGKEEIVFKQPYLISGGSLVAFNLENLEKSAAERSISVFAEGFTVLTDKNKLNKFKNGYNR